jgi:hypothetical protein
MCKYYTQKWQRRLCRMQPAGETSDTLGGITSGSLVYVRNRCGQINTNILGKTMENQDTVVGCTGILAPTGVIGIHVVDALGGVAEKKNFIRIKDMGEALDSDA